jgi:hypothetical protein
MSPTQRLLGALAILALVALGSTDLASSSYAESDIDAGGTLTATNVTSSPSGCSSGRYAFAAGSGYASWSFEGEIDSPGGYFEPAYLETGTASDTFVLCGADNPTGTYTITGHFEGLNVHGDVLTASDFSTTFTYKIQQPASTAIRVSVKRSHLAACPGKANKHCWLLLAHTSRQGRTWGHAHVDLQSYRRGAWHAVVHCTTNVNGNCRIFVQATKKSSKYPLRFHLKPTGTTKASVSRTFRLRYA